MGMFNFLKKKELAEIQRLQHENWDLETKLIKLKKYENIVDTELEAKRIIEEAKHEAALIIQKAKEDVVRMQKWAERTRTEAEGILKMSEKQGVDILNAAQQEASEIRISAKRIADELRQKADGTLQNASRKAEEIIKEAERKAIEIAGDAFKVAQNAAEYEKTAKAMKNIIEGYGDQYIVPTQSLLDDLAGEFGYTEAGVKLKDAREQTMLMIKSGGAARCDYVETYRRETAINFVLDAFNGKVDSILSKVKKDNYGTLEQKIKDAYQLVNSNGAAFRNAVITPQYLSARINELKWAVVAQELKWNEQEEQRRIKEQIREEERARREFEKAIRDAEKEEETLKKLIEKAQKEIQQVSDEQKAKYEAKLKEYEEKLKAAEEKNQRALSMAQQTKSGNVYIISNIGSFGENVYKIGMTRRLEPFDRIRELGDASVPFEFDVHAMIYSQDAPKLETNLHKNFIANQVNKVNPRKEFFKISLAEIKKEIEKMGVETRWTIAAEARQYRETLAIEKSIKDNENSRLEWEKSQLKYEVDLDTNEINN